MAKIYVQTNADGEIIHWGTSRSSDQDIELDIEDTHPFFTSNSFFFKLTDGVLAESETTKTRIRSERSKNREVHDLKRFMADTDFYYIRKQEENEEVPVDVKTKRKEARKRLKELGL